MFNMKFHSDERSLDITRRRRWHRKMIPDSLTFDHSNEGIIANTDVVFRMQSRIEQQEKEIKIQFNAPRIFLTFKSKSKSSF